MTDRAAKLVLWIGTLTSAALFLALTVDTHRSSRSWGWSAPRPTSTHSGRRRPEPRPVPTNRNHPRVRRGDTPLTGRAVAMAVYG
jgi:hypothetical protein